MVVEESIEQVECHHALECRRAIKVLLTRMEVYQMMNFERPKKNPGPINFCVTPQIHDRPNPLVFHFPERQVTKLGLYTQVLRVIKKYKLIPQLPPRGHIYGYNQSIVKKRHPAQSHSWEDVGYTCHSRAVPDRNDSDKMYQMRRMESNNKRCKRMHRTYPTGLRQSN